MTGENPSKTIIFIYNGENLANPSSIHCRCSPGDRDFRYAAIEAGEVVWKSGLVKKVGLADGVSGNSYAFLSLYRLTGETVYEERAKAFAGFLYHNAKERTGGAGPRTPAAVSRALPGRPACGSTC